MDNVQIALTIFGALVGSSAGFGFIQFLITRRDKRKEELKNNNLDGLRKELKQHLVDVNDAWKVTYCDHNKNTIDHMSEQHQRDFQTLLGAIEKLESNDTKITENIRLITETQKDIGDAIIGLAHDKIVFTTDKIIERGAVTMKEKATLESIYRPYVKLGGNSYAKKGVEHVEKLPVVTEEEAKAMDIKIKNNQRTIV